jgi:hypothetical protein
VAPRGQDPNATTFVAADVIGSEGIGQHGELLLDALNAAYPPELQAVLNYRPNDELDGVLFSGGYEDRLDVHGKIAKVIDLPDLKLGDRTVKGKDRILRARVRGGADENGRNRDSSQAWISYVALDDTGDNVFKGVLPFLDLDSSSSDRHFSQLRAAAETPAGKRYLEARRKQQEADGESPVAQQAPPDPVGFFREAKASEVIAVLEEHPDDAEEIKTLYEAVNPRPAKSVLEWEPESSGDDNGSGSEGSGSEGGGAAEGSGEGGGQNPPAS